LRAEANLPIDPELAEDTSIENPDGTDIENNNGGNE